MADDGLEARVRELEMKDAADRERLLGLLERSERELFPLVEMYGRMDERFNTVLRDLGAAHEALRKLEETVEAEREAHREHQQAQQKLIAAAREERHEQIAQLEQKQKANFAQIVAGIITVFLTSLGGVVIAYLQQKGGVK